jgi:signal transduction histidine kinase
VRQRCIKPEVIDINESIALSQNMLRRLIGEEINLVFRPAADLARTKFDPGQIEQILFNLAVNARDAMPDGGSLAVETRNVRLEQGGVADNPETQAGTYVLLQISDSGQGMNQETRRLIFEPFFTTKSFGTGTGLGLSTVYGIIKQHGGYIEVSSVLGEGTTFNIYLPVAQQVPEREINSSSEPQPRG